MVIIFFFVRFWIWADPLIAVLKISKDNISSNPQPFHNSYTLSPLFALVGQGVKDETKKKTIKNMYEIFTIPEYNAPAKIAEKNVLVRQLNNNDWSAYRFG
jgi:hypothetical protein